MSEIRCDWPALVASLLLLVGCQQAALAPVDISAEDICASCKMAISEKRYAAEFLTKDGEPVKFDDIACMARYVQTRQHKDTIATYFVVDFDSRQWVPAEAAHYVRSVDFQTPMRSGIVAYQDEAQAQAAVAVHHGTLLRFADLLG